MTTERLQEIVELKNFHAIEKELNKEKYFDMAKHPILKKISLVPIIQSKNFVRLDDVETDKFNFIIAKNDDVIEYSEHEFVWIQVDKFDKRKEMWIPYILKMYAKEKVQNG